MRDPAYNYRKFFRYPIKIYQLGKGEKALVFSKGVEIRQILISLLIVLIFYLFRNYINMVLPGQLQLAFYVVLPWIIAGQICRSKLDGKRLDRFFIQYFIYLFTGKHQYSSLKPVYVKQLKEPQQYERLR